MLKIKSESLVVLVIILLVLITIGGSFKNSSNSKIEETSSTDGSDQKEVVQGDECEECKCVIEMYIENEKHVQHLRETGWLLSKPDSDFVEVNLWASGILSSDNRSHSNYWPSMKDSYKLVTDVIKEDFPNADFGVGERGVSIDISPQNDYSGIDLLTIRVLDDYEFSTTFAISGSRDIENIDKVTEKILLAFTKARHPAISNHNMAKYTSPGSKEEESFTHSTDKHGKVSFEYFAEVELKK